MLPFCVEPTFWLAAAFLLLLAANLFVFLKRDWEASFRPSSYATLNYPLDVPTLREWKLEGPDSLRLDLAWNQTPESWQLWVDGQLAETMPGSHPRIRLVGPLFDGSSGVLDDFKHTYVLKPQPAGLGPDLTFAITRISRRYYLTRGMTFTNDVLLFDTEMPVGQFARHPVSHWVDDCRHLSASELAAADRVVRDEIGILDSDATLARMEKVMRYLRTKLAEAGGVPKDDFRWMNPWQIFQEMSRGTGKGWCTQNAQIYVFFANRAGIPTRFVFGANTQQNTVIYNGHSWAESWVKEQGRWTHVDPSHSLIAIQDRHGVFLNTADILHLREHDAFDGITARIFKDWHWPDLAIDAAPGVAVNVPFALVNILPKTHLNRQSIVKYRHPPNVEDVRGRYSMLLKNRTFAWENFKRYLFDPPLAYSMLPTDSSRTYLVRQSLFGALAVAAVLLACHCLCGCGGSCTP
jgi:transglutaminase-like putative cysteine protease